MRLTATLALAAAALGLGVSQPAAAFDDTHGVGTVYIHHHVYYPPRYVHVYHHHRPAARHINVVHYAHDCCGYGHGRGYGFFAPRRSYYWHGFRRHW